jgi:hypothetical protein
MQQSTNSTKLCLKKTTKSPKSPNSGKVRKEKVEYDASLAPQIPFLDQFNPEASNLSLREAFELLVAFEENQALEDKSPLRDKKPLVKRTTSRSQSRDKTKEAFQEEYLEENQAVAVRSSLRDKKPLVKKLRKSKSRSRGNAVETFQDEDI